MFHVLGNKRAALQGLMAYLRARPRPFDCNSQKDLRWEKSTRAGGDQIELFGGCDTPLHSGGNLLGFTKKLLGIGLSGKPLPTTHANYLTETEREKMLEHLGLVPKVVENGGVE